MRVPPDLPRIALVCVESAGGPYRPGDRLSLAFVVPTVGRVVAHDGDVAIRANVATEDGVVPETVTVVVETAAVPYALGERLTLAFVDPRVARIQPLVVRERIARDGDDAANDPTRATVTERRPSAPLPAPTLARMAADQVRRVERTSESSSSESLHGRGTNRTNAPTGDGRSLEEVAGGAIVAGSDVEVARHAVSAPGVVVRLAWTPERVRRFVQVVDKLFTVDRLGWYRHTLAMRLLIPDDVTCGDALGDIEAMRHLHALRSAAVETLGRPLLAAFMPNFNVSTEWLASLDSAHTVRAVVGVRDALLPFVSEAAPSLPLESGFTVRAIRRGDLALGATSVEGSIATLVPTTSTNGALTDCLEAYRVTLVDVFGQTAQAAEAVRVNGMTQPNHSLDDRLWQLVGAVGETFDGLAVA